jgi:hypothetical protein
VRDWQNIAVVGEPLAYGIGLLALVLVAFAGDVTSAIVTVAHEGGHMLAGLLSGRGISGFTLDDGPEPIGGGTYYAVGDSPNAFMTFAGYATPPLAGLGGAYVISDGNAWGVLVIGVVLLLAILLIPEINLLALVVTGLLLIGFLWALIAGGPGIQAAVAVGLVWLLLIGGLRIVLIRNINSSDGAALAGRYWIPRIVSFAAWLAIAVVSLWVGGRVLLGYT